MEKKEQQDISEFLAIADEENELARAKHVELRQGMKTTQVSLPLVTSVEETKKTKRANLDAETAELVSKYSTREMPDEKNNTKELRDTLAKRLEDDKLRGYLDTSAGINAKKADGLRSIIRDAGSMTAEELEKRVSERFSDESAVPKEQDRFEQAEMFQLGDGATLKEAPAEMKYASYDKDYENLGERVVAGGIPEKEDDGQLSFLPDETDVAPIDADEDDVDLRLAFDMMQDGDAVNDEKPEKIYKKKKKVKEDVLIRYTDRSQNGEFGGKLHRAFLLSALRLLLCGVALVFLGRIEFGDLFGFLTGQGTNGIRLYLLVDLQFVFLCALTVLPAVCRGVKGIARHKLTSEAFLVAGLAVNLLYVVFCMILTPKADAILLYGFLCGLASLCAAGADVMNSWRNRHAFRMVSTKRPKYVAKKVTDTRKEAEEFGRFLYEDSEIYTVKRTHFAEEFSERSAARSSFDDLYHFVLPVILGAGVVLTAVMAFLGNNASASVQAGYALWAVSLPTTAFFMMPLPLLRVNKKGRKCSAAFIGNGVADEYSMASVLTFADTEVFPFNLVNVTNIKTYGDYPIDKVITDLTAIFGHLGGPMQTVTKRIMESNQPVPENIRVIENTSDGICVAMDGRNFYLGKRSYLKRRDFEAPADQGDDGYENGVGSIMYFAIDKETAAKLYIRYRVNSKFEILLHDLHRAGVCLGVKTMDPNITTDRILSGISFKKCPIAVLKQDDPAEVTEESERDSSGIVCNSSLHNFLSMFALCDKVRHAVRCNAIITLVSVFLSFAAVGFLAVVGELHSFGILQATVFQLCCQVPVWALSLLMI